MLGGNLGSLLYRDVSVMGRTATNVKNIAKTGTTATDVRPIYYSKMNIYSINSEKGMYLIINSVSVSCFGVRISVMFHFMFVHYTFGLVWVAEWPPLGK